MRVIDFLYSIERVLRQADVRAEQPWAAVGMDLFMEKPVNRDKLRHMLDLLEHDHWRGSSAGSQPAVNSRNLEQPGQEAMHVQESQRCDSLGSFSSGMDVKVCDSTACCNISTPLLVNVFQGCL